MLSTYGKGGSAGTTGSAAKTGSAGTSVMAGRTDINISNLVDEVMNPKPDDTFTMIFPKYVSMYSLAKYNYDPVTARNALINDYDTIQRELQTAVETEQDSKILFAADPQGESCKQINTMTLAFYQRLIDLYKGAQDLSGAVYNAGSFHDENINLQNIVLSTCSTRGSEPSNDCKKLATMDEKLFALLPRLDAMNINILADGSAIQDMIDTLVQAYIGMGCTRSTDGSATPDGIPSIDTIFSDTYVESLRDIDTDFLNEKLQELSPYYVSPNIINYISGKLIGALDINAEISDSLDYLKDMNKVTNTIVSLNTDVSSLEKGKFFSESGAEAGGFINCPAGYYCPVTTSMPIECPVGTYCPPGTTDEPIDCPEGLFSPAGATNVSQCTKAWPLGYYIDSTGKLVKCPTGGYCAEGIRTMCPQGTYNKKKGMSSIKACLDCPKGSYCKTPTTITPCDAGTYNNKSREFSSNGCLPCPEGTTCPNKGIVTPKPCQPGTYSNMVGLKGACTPVIQGYYLPGTGGRNDNGKLGCPVGYYCPGGTGAPVISPIGSYCSEVRLARPTLCPAGTYGSVLGLLSNLCSGKCDAGYLCPPGSSSSTAVPCPQGYYCPAGTGTAIICPTGAYCPRLSPSPVSCPEGTYNLTAGKINIDDCLPCPAGEECGVGTTNPIPCRVGFYCPGGGARNPCPSGHYCDRTGLIDPEMCPPGTYKPGGGYLITACLPCQAGTWSSTRGEIGGCSNTCGIETYCPSPKSMSTYSIPSSGLNEYRAAMPQGTVTPQGTITMPIGSTEPVPCPIGTYCPTVGMGVPTPCPPGTYSAQTGVSICQPCEPGKFCPNAGAGSQLLCPVGTFCPTQGGSRAMQCPIGQICPVPGLQAGMTCPPGKLCDITGLGVPPPPYKICPEGTYSTGGAGSSCTPCSTGYYGSGDSSTSQCSGLCPAGYYCPPGTTQLGGRNAPILCPLGHYCPTGTIMCREGTTSVNGICMPSGSGSGSRSGSR